MADRVDLPIEGAGGHEGMRWAATKVAFGHRQAAFMP
jgi:hypothetical protein